MSIFVWALIWALIGRYAPCLVILALAILAFFVADYGRRVLYQIGIDGLELFARWQAQQLDNHKQVAALEISSQAQRLQLAPGWQATIQQAEWLLQHQHDIEIEPVAEDTQEGIDKDTRLGL